MENDDAVEDLEALWGDAQPWRAVVSSDCLLVRADEEWFDAGGRFHRKRSVDFAKLTSGPTLEALRDHAIGAAREAGFGSAADEEDPARTALEREESSLRVGIASEPILAAIGLAEILRIEFEETATKAPSFAPSGLATSMLRRRLGISAQPSRIRRERFFALHGMLAEELVETFEFPEVVDPSVLNRVLGPAKDEAGTWASIFAGPTDDTLFSVEVASARGSVRAVLTTAQQTLASRP